MHEDAGRCPEHAHEAYRKAGLACISRLLHLRAPLATAVLRSGRGDRSTSNLVNANKQPSFPWAPSAYLSPWICSSLFLLRRLYRLLPLLLPLALYLRLRKTRWCWPALQLIFGTSCEIGGYIDVSVHDDVALWAAHNTPLNSLISL